MLSTLLAVPNEVADLEPRQAFSVRYAMIRSGLHTLMNKLVLLLLCVITLEIMLGFLWVEY